jgi:hypothetical protein
MIHIDERPRPAEADAIRPYALFQIFFIQFPFRRIVDDVFPNAIQILFIMDNMVKIIPLSDRKTM